MRMRVGGKVRMCGRDDVYFVRVHFGGAEKVRIVRWDRRSRY
jgi:hypothetical protein